MRTVHFVWEFPPRIVGGLGTFAGELTRHLVIMGHEATVMTMNENNRYSTIDNWRGVDVHRPQLADFSEMYRSFVDNDLRSWGTNLRFFADVITYNTLATTKFVNQITRNGEMRFDLIHAHDWLGIVGGVSTKINTGLPLIFHVHSTEKGRSMGMGSRTVEGLEFSGARNADMVITVSNAMKKEIVTLGMAPPEKVQVCWNGVDTTKYSRKNVDQSKVEGLRSYYRITDGEKIILFVGRFVSVKGMDNLVRGMPAVLESHPNTKLILLGHGDMSDALHNLIRKNGLQERVIIRDEFVSEEERIAHYALADLCVFPSVYEPFGIVCTEAMSMGIPVVVGASGTSGFREQIIPEGSQMCGVHVNGNEPKDIAWGIDVVLSSDSDMKRMGANARKRAVKHYDWKKITGEILQLYDYCVKDSKGTSGTD